MTLNEHPSERFKLLVSQLIDGQLMAEEAAELNALMNGDSKAVENVVDQLMLDSLLSDELGSESLTALVDLVSEGPVDNVRSTPVRSLSRSTGWFSVTFASCALVLAAFFIRQLFIETPVSAAVTELDRIITASTETVDRTYQITVEEAILPPGRGQRPRLPEHGRPPKPPLDGALLHVRGDQQFVLERITKEGLPFVTGSNGRTSWAVRPDGPVRVSSDLTRFNRDVPGHEHSMSLIKIHDGLEHLRNAYEIQLLPIENQEDNLTLKESPIRLIVAVKKRNGRGPRRVEITYSIRDGLIQQMRFIEMPYGPERLTLRMTLVEERDLGEAFFDHESHHAADRKVEFE